MITRLPESGEELEDVCIVVKHGSLLHVTIKLCASEHVERIIKIAFHLVHLAGMYLDCKRGQVNVRRAFSLCASKLRRQEDVLPKGQESLASIAHVTIAIDRIDDVLIEVAVMTW